MGQYRQVYILDGGKDNVVIELMSSDVEGEEAAEVDGEEQIETITLQPYNTEHGDLLEAIELVNFSGTLVIMRNHIKRKELVRVHSAPVKVPSVAPKNVEDMQSPNFETDIFEDRSVDFYSDESNGEDQVANEEDKDEKQTNQDATLSNKDFDVEEEDAGRTREPSWYSRLQMSVDNLQPITQDSESDSEKHAAMPSWDAMCKKRKSLSLIEDEDSSGVKEVERWLQNSQTEVAVNDDNILELPSNMGQIPMYSVPMTRLSANGCSELTNGSGLTSNFGTTNPRGSILKKSKYTFQNSSIDSDSTSCSGHDVTKPCDFRRSTDSTLSNLEHLPDSPVRRARRRPRKETSSPTKPTTLRWDESLHYVRDRTGGSGVLIGDDSAHSSDGFGRRGSNHQRPSLISWTSQPLLQANKRMVQLLQSPRFSQDKLLNPGTGRRESGANDWKAILMDASMVIRMPSSIRLKRIENQIEDMERLNISKDLGSEQASLVLQSLKKSLAAENLEGSIAPLFDGYYDGDSGSDSESYDADVDQVDRILHSQKYIENMTKLKSLIYPTELHRICAEPNATLSQLENAKKASGRRAPSLPDALGRLPLHILGDNAELISSPEGKLIASTFSLRLMRAHPSAITRFDKRQRMPFVGIIEDWCKWVRENMEAAEVCKSLGSLGASRSALLESIGNLGSSSPRRKNKTFKSRVISETHPLPVTELWDEAEWSFCMLSVAMDELGGKGGDMRDNINVSNVTRMQADQRAALAKHVLRVCPDLLKIVFLIEQDGGAIRERLLNLSLFRRVLACPESAGPWLTSMLRKKGTRSKQALGYLTIISNLTVKDYAGKHRILVENDYRAFYDNQNHLFDETSRIRGIVASLAVLESRDLQKAASTAVVKYILSRSLKRPFLVGLVLMDFVLHVSLMIAFSTQVRVYFDKQSVWDNVPRTFILFIGSHYIIRKVIEGFSLLTLSPKVFKAYYTNLWTLFDLTTVALTIYATIWNDRHPDQYRGGINAFITGLLWIKVLGFLKVVNQQMATFIMALVQIFRDLRFFAAVLMVIVFMFGDMMQIVVTSHDDEQFCDDDENGDTINDFCTPGRYRSYLRVYALLIGDISLNQYSEPTGLTILFVMFTVVGVVIMLNVIIAVISDSYERSKVGSLLLLGMARIVFVAQHESLEAFLRPGTDVMQEIKTEDTYVRTQVKRFGRFFRWLVLLSLVATTFNTQKWLIESLYNMANDGMDGNYWDFFVIFVLALCLAFSIFIVSGFALEWFLQNHAPSVVSDAFNSARSFTDRILVSLSALMFGLRENRFQFGSTDNEEEEDEDEWTSRVAYMEKSFERNLVRTTEDLKKEMLELEKRLNARHANTYR